MDDVRVSRRVVIPAGELTMTAMRSSGPGGQSVNTTDSKVELRWNIATSTVLTDQDRQRLRERLGSRLTNDDELILRAQEHRSQARNREAVRARLAALVGEALAPQRRRTATVPSARARRRRVEAKRRRGEIKRLRQSNDD